MESDFLNAISWFLVRLHDPGNFNLALMGVVFPDAGLLSRD